MKSLCHRLKRQQLFPDGFQNLGPVHIFPDQRPEGAKIPVHHRRVSGITAGLQSFLGGPDGHTLQRRYRIFPLKIGDNTGFRRALSLPVAAPRGLGYGIQPGDFPPDRREIHIHTGLNQRGGHHPAGKPFPEPLSDLRQDLFPMGRIHQGRKMESSHLRKKGIEGPGRLSGIYNAQGLILPGQFLCQCLLRAFSALPIHHSAKTGKGTGNLRAQLPDGLFRAEATEQIPQHRLGGGTQDHRGAELGYQRSHGPHAGKQMAGGDHLGFVKNHYAVGNVVQLPALGRTVSVKRFKKLHRGGNDHRGIPVFRGQPLQAVVLVCLPLILKGDPAVVLYHVCFPQNVPEYPGVLLDDGGVGDHIDHPVQALGDGVVQGKGQGGNGFSAPCGNGQAIKPPGLRCLFDAL